MRKIGLSLLAVLMMVGCATEGSRQAGLNREVDSLSRGQMEGMMEFLSLDMPSVWGKTRDFQAIGGRYSTLEDILQEILAEEGFYYSYYSQSNQGYFYRSDQFNFAKQGIPAMWLEPGEDYVGGGNPKDEYRSKYHTVEDEFDPN